MEILDAFTGISSDGRAYIPEYIMNPVADKSQDFLAMGAGEKIPMTKGKIQLQSEATEVYYKNIEIRDLESLPAKYAQYYE